MYNKYDILPIEDREYLIIDVLEYNDTTYLYLVNNSDSDDDKAIVKVLYEGDADYVVNIDNDDEFNYVLSLFAGKNKENIKEVLENKNED